MVQAQQTPLQQEAYLKLNHQIHVEASIWQAYAEAAVKAAQAGFSDLYRDYSKLSEEAHKRHDELKAQL